jgi:hypothetical protein
MLPAPWRVVVLLRVEEHQGKVFKEEEWLTSD